MDYKELTKMESFGTESIGIKIDIASSIELDLEHEIIVNVKWKVMDLLEAAVKEVLLEKNPNTPIATENNKAILTVFNEPIFVEEIPNEYCGRYCCKHLPWFIVTTSVGRIKIGSRKRVINIDWKDTVGTLESDELFSDEETTKGNKYIHAWSLEDATRYVEKILSTAKR